MSNMLNIIFFLNLVCRLLGFFNVTFGQSYSEYVNRDYVLIKDDDEIWHSAINASVYCMNEIGTSVASFASKSDIDSFRSLASAHDLLDEPCWLGLYDYNGDNNGWAWVNPDANYDFNLTNDTYDFNNVNQRCAYFYPGNSEINDWYCFTYKQMSYFVNSVLVYKDVASCFVCTKPKYRNYTISITTSTDTGSGTIDNIWFRIQGSIENVTNDETWTDWFEFNGFYNSDTIYTIRKELINVGPISKLIILNQNSDGIKIVGFSVDGGSTYGINTANGGILLEYAYGASNDGCSFMIINVASLSYGDYSTDYSNENDTCPYHLYLPTVEPTLSPSLLPSVIPTQNPTMNDNSATDEEISSSTTNDGNGGNGGNNGGNEGGNTNDGDDNDDTANNDEFFSNGLNNMNTLELAVISMGIGFFTICICNIIICGWCYYKRQKANENMKSKVMIDDDTTKTKTITTVVGMTSNNNTNDGVNNEDIYDEAPMTPNNGKNNGRGGRGGERGSRHNKNSSNDMYHDEELDDALAQLPNLPRMSLHEQDGLAQGNHGNGPQIIDAGDGYGNTDTNNATNDNNNNDTNNAQKHGEKDNVVNGSGSENDDDIIMDGENGTLAHNGSVVAAPAFAGAGAVATGVGLPRTHHNDNDDESSSSESIYNDENNNLNEKNIGAAAYMTMGNDNNNDINNNNNNNENNGLINGMSADQVLELALEEAHVTNGQKIANGQIEGLEGDNDANSTAVTNTQQ